MAADELTGGFGGVQVSLIAIEVGLLGTLYPTFDNDDTTKSLIACDGAPTVSWNSKDSGRTSRIGTRSFCDSIGQSDQAPFHVWL